MTIDLNELAGRALAYPPTATPLIGAICEMAAKRQRRRARRFAVATVIVCMLLVGGAWAALDGRASTVETVTGTGQPTLVEGVAMGEFVWPAPQRGFESADQLARAFLTEVLDWADGTAAPSPDAPADVNGPTWLQLARPTASIVIEALAVPSEHGWGFIQIGNDTMTIRQDSPETGRLWFTPPPLTTVTNTSVRYATTSIEITTDQDLVELPESPAWYEVTSVLVVHRNDEDEVIGVAGRQLAGQDVEQAPALTTTVPPDAVSPRQLDTIEDVEQLIDDYGNCVTSNAQGGSLAIQLDRAVGTIGEMDMSHQTRAGIDAIDTHAELCDASLAFSTSLANRTGPPAPNSEWIIFGDPSLAFEGSDLVIEVHLGRAATPDQSDEVGAWLSGRPDVDQVTFYAPSAYRITPREPANTPQLIDAIAVLDGLDRIWIVASAS